MSLSHQIKEEETLVAYFKQMLTDSVDETDDVKVPSFDTDIDDHSELNDEVHHLEQSHEPLEVQLQEKQETKVEPLPTIEKPKQKSLESLLQSVSTVTQEDLKIATETKVEEPEVQIAEPEVQIAEPEVQIAEPEVQIAEPEVQIAEPEVQIAEPEVQIAEPEVQIAEHEVKIAEPEVKIAEPEVKIAEPEVKVAEPEVKVAEPEVQIAEPEVKIATPSINVDISTDTQVQVEAQDVPKNEYEWKNIDTEEEFQTLFFVVQGVRYAVPLIDLGAIIECKKITQIFGKPSWYMGLTDVRGRKLNIVDTLRWVKPEVNQSPEIYPYLVSLSNSDWSLGCNQLEGNRTISRDQVNWRKTAGTRPWLAGIVKKEMCALLHVGELIRLFEQGMDQKSIIARENKVRNR